MKKICVSLILFAVALSLFASGGQQTATSSGYPVNERGLPITKELVTVNVTLPSNANRRAPLGEMKPVLETEKKTNVHIVWTEIANTGWQEKVNLLIASGDFPDAFYGNVNLARNIDSFAPLDDSINKYAPAVQQLLKDRPDIKSRLPAPDGKIYSLPTGGETYNNLSPDQVWINKTWLDALGLKMPATIKEFENVLIAFKEKDPNKNGKADETPFSFCQSGEGNSQINSIFGSFGALYTDSALRVQDGKVIFSPGERGFYDCLVWFHSLYSRGLIDKEAFIQNQQQYNAKFKSGETLGAFLAFSPDFIVDPAIASHYPAMPPLTGPNGQKPVWRNGNPGEMYNFTIPKTSNYRDVMIRLYDHLSSSMENMLEWAWGTRDYAWRMRPDGKWEIASENQPADMAYGVWRHSTSPASSSLVFFKKEWVGPDAQHFTTERDLIKIAGVKAYLPYLETEFVTNNLRPVDDETNRNLLWVEIDKYLKGFVAQSITNGINEAGWNAHLAALRNLKADEYTAITQKYYKSSK